MRESGVVVNLVSGAFGCNSGFQRNAGSILASDVLPSPAETSRSRSKSARYLSNSTHDVWSV
jgi:hypothetical protein